MTMCFVIVLNFLLSCSAALVSVTIPSAVVSFTSVDVMVEVPIQNVTTLLLTFCDGLEQLATNPSIPRTYFIPHTFQHPNDHCGLLVGVEFTNGTIVHDHDCVVGIWGTGSTLDSSMAIFHPDGSLTTSRLSPSTRRPVYGTTIHWHTTIPNLRMLYGSTYLTDSTPGGDLHRWFLNGTYDRQMCDAFDSAGHASGQGLFLTNNRFLVPSAQRGVVLQYVYSPAGDIFYNDLQPFAASTGYPIYLTRSPRDNAILVSRYSGLLVSELSITGSLLRNRTTGSCNPQQLAYDGEFIWTTCYNSKSLARAKASETKGFQLVGTLASPPNGIAIGPDQLLHVFTNNDYVTLDRTSLAVKTLRSYSGARFGFGTFIPHHFVRIVGSEAELPTPVPTPMPTPKPTPVPTPMPTPMPSPKPTPMPSPEPTPMPIGGPPAATSDPVLTPTATVPTSVNDPNLTTDLTAVATTLMARLSTFLTNTDTSNPSDSATDTTLFSSIYTTLFGSTQNEVINSENPFSLEVIIGIAAGGCCAVVTVIVVIVLLLKRSGSNSTDNSIKSSNSSSVESSGASDVISDRDSHYQAFPQSDVASTQYDSGLLVHMYGEAPVDTASAQYGDSSFARLN